MGGRIDDFLIVVDYIYRGRSARTCARSTWSSRTACSPKKNPFFEHGEGARLLRVPQRLVPSAASPRSIDREHLDRYEDATGFFGFLDTVDDEEVARALLGRAESWLRGKGMKRVARPVLAQHQRGDWAASSTASTRRRTA